MTQIKHIKSEVYAEITGVSISTVTGFAKIELKYYDHYTDTDSRLNNFQFSTDDGSNWFDCLEPLNKEFTTLPASDTQGIEYLYWDAAKQLGCWQASSDVKIRVNFYDDTPTGGTLSDYAEYTISSIDFTHSTIQSENITRPKAHDPYFVFDFETPTFLKATNISFKIVISENADLSNPVVEKDTTEDTTGWTVDGNAFSSSGTMLGLESHSIICDDNIAASLSDNTDYYYEVQINSTQANYNSVSLASGLVNKTVKHGLTYNPLVWFREKDTGKIHNALNYGVKHLDSSIQFSTVEALNKKLDLNYWQIEPKTETADGVSSITVTHNLGYYPYVWFVNSSTGETYTANNYEVIYDSTNAFTVNFYETVSNIEVHYDLGNGASPTTTTASVGDSEKTINHDLGGYPIFWGKDASGTMITVNNYLFKYLTLSSAKAEFGEQLTEQITLIYRG